MGPGARPLAAPPNLDKVSHLEAQGEGEERRRLDDGVVVEVWPRPAAELQHVAEALRGDQARADAAALDHHGGRHRRAVADGAIFPADRPNPPTRARGPVPIASEGSAGVEGTVKWRGAPSRVS